ncbi:MULTISPECIES: OmpA family protein [unclassified Inquilinus]|uniref:OmpA family protein n=1 Tax=unclassified Inquilinus TaxID=2645927 RepID=UPI003F911E62
MTNRRETGRRVRLSAAALLVPVALLLGISAAAAQDAAGDLVLDTRILSGGEAQRPQPLPVPTSSGPVTGPIPFLEPSVRQAGIPSLPQLPDAPSSYDADVMVKGAGFADPNVKVAAMPEMAPGDTVGLVPGNGFRIRFAPGVEEMDTTAGDMLSGLSERLVADATSQIEIRAYAGPKPDPAGSRRVSLSRALNIRAFLIDRGIDNKRIAIRALGNTSPPDQPADRVDLRIQ